MQVTNDIYLSMKSYTCVSFTVQHNTVERSKYLQHNNWDDRMTIEWWGSAFIQNSNSGTNMDFRWKYDRMCNMQKSAVVAISLYCNITELKWGQFSYRSLRHYQSPIPNFQILTSPFPLLYQEREKEIDLKQISTSHPIYSWIGLGWDKPYSLLW